MEDPRLGYQVIVLSQMAREKVRRFNSSDSRFHHRKMATAERKMHNDPGVGLGGRGVMQPS